MHNSRTVSLIAYAPAPSLTRSLAAPDEALGDLESEAAEKLVLLGSLIMGSGPPRPNSLAEVYK
jgi:hypothetical protein